MEAGDKDVTADNPIGAPCNLDTINKAPPDLAEGQPIQESKHSSKTLEQLSGGSHLLDTSSIEVKQCKENTASVSSPPDDYDDDVLPLLQLQQPNNAKEKELIKIDTQSDISCHEQLSTAIGIQDEITPRIGENHFFCYTVCIFIINERIILDYDSAWQV